MKDGPLSPPEERRPGDVVGTDAVDETAVGQALTPDPELERRVFHHLAQALRELAPDL